MCTLTEPEIRSGVLMAKQKIVALTAVGRMLSSCDELGGGISRLFGVTGTNFQYVCCCQVAFSLIGSENEIL